MINLPPDHSNKSTSNSGESYELKIGSLLFKSGTSQTEIDTVVWTALKQGDRKALDYIFEKYIRLLYTYGGKIIKDSALVEDCIQDIFIELWKRRENLSNTDNIKFYLLKALRRRIVRKLSTENREHRHQALAADSSDSMYSSFESNLIQLQITSEQQQQLFSALENLSKRQREAIYLKFYERMTYEQLSEVLEIDLKSSYKLIGKAIDSLRKWVRPVF